MKKLKAMIFCAGVGSRLGELTKLKPKPLIEIADNLPILKHIIKRISEIGVTDFIINLHHLPEMIPQFLKTDSEIQKLNLKFFFSKEAELHDTGGGLKKAWDLIFKDTTENVIVHNGDIYSDIDLQNIVTEHINTGAISTLAVMKRDTTRVLLFDKQMQLAGWRVDDKEKLVADNSQELLDFGFTGIQVINRNFFNVLKDFEGKFSIIENYLAARRAGLKITGFDVTGSKWIDIGRPEHLAEVRKI